MIASPTTDAFGEVSANWQQGPMPSDARYLARLKASPEVAISTAIRTTRGLPNLAASNIVNAASQETASAGCGFAPGGLVTLHGSELALDERVAGPDTEANVPTLPDRLGPGLIRVHVGGVGAPLSRVSPLQVTCQLPFWADGPSVKAGVATVCGRSATTAIPVSAVQPGIFPDRISRADSGDVPVESQSENLPGAGEQLRTHCTSLGAVSPAGRTGVAGGSETPQLVIATTEAWVDNRTVKVEFSGLSTLKAGVYEIVVLLPSDLTAGEHYLQIAADGVRSNAVVCQTK